MPDDPNLPAGQAPPVDTGQTPETVTNPPAVVEPGAPPPASSAQEADARDKQIAELRKEAAATRKAKTDLEARLKAFEDEKLSEQEKRENRLKELETQNQALERQNRIVKIESVAARMGCVDPELVSGAITVADGQTVEEAVTAFLDAKPYLKAGPVIPTPPVISATNPAGVNTANPNVFRKSQLSDPAFYEANRDAILRAAAEGRVVDG